MIMSAEPVYIADVKGNVKVSGEMRKRKPRSLVWNDFTKEWREDGSCIAICNNCKKQLTAGSKSGTSHLKNHLLRCSSGKQIKKKKLPVSRNSGKLRSGTIVEVEHSQTDQELKLQYGQFSQEVSRQDLARMVILHHYPFEIVHHYGFRTFLKNLQPQFNLVSSDIVKLDCMNIYENAKLKLQSVLEKLCSRVSLTIDTWRSMSDAEYLCLTGHFIDEDWKLQKKIIDFVLIEPALGGQNITKIILEKLHEWKLVRKITNVILDNCVDNDSISKELLGSLKDFLHLDGNLFLAHPCCRLLDLVVQDGLKVASNLIDQVRDCVHFVRCSQERLSKFQTIAKPINYAERPLVLDAPTSWISTFTMLDTAYQYQDAFIQLAEFDLELKKFIFPKENWNDIGAIVECLEVLCHAYEKFLSTTTPTANLYFNDICGIHLLLKPLKKSELTLVASMANEMLEKLCQHWEFTRMLMAIASILDPRYKMKSVEYFFKHIYDDPNDAKTRINDVRNCLMYLHNEYVLESANSSGDLDFFNCVGGSASNSARGGQAKRYSRITLSDTQRGLDQYLQETSSSEPSKTDLDMYLEESVYRMIEGPDSNFNVLTWWKHNTAKYPVLSRMTRDILAIPVSTTPLDSERRTLNDYLSSVDPETVRCLFCAQNWLGDETEFSTVDTFANFL